MSNCKDCDDCARHAYSDATTPGFFYDKCEKHRLTPAAPPSLPSGKQEDDPEWMDDSILVCGKHAVVFTKEGDECFVCTNRQPSGKPTEEEAP